MLLAIPLFYCKIIYCNKDLTIWIWSIHLIISSSIPSLHCIITTKQVSISSCALRRTTSWKTRPLSNSFSQACPCFTDANGHGSIISLGTLGSAIVNERECAAEIQWKHTVANHLLSFPWDSKSRVRNSGIGSQPKPEHGSTFHFSHFKKSRKCWR